MKKLSVFCALFALILIVSGCQAAGNISSASDETLFPTEEIPLAAAPDQPQEITPVQPKEIALDHAGLAEEEVTAFQAEFDKDDNHWDVDFRVGDWEYDYEIHSESGAVLKSDKEYDPEKQAVSAPAETQPTQSDATRLTAEEAKAIALTHAGLTEEQVRSLKAEFDKDDNHWDVEFRAGDWEYDYEIHGESGAVLKSDKEYDPEKQAVSAPAETQPTQSDAARLSAEEAKAIALTHAGLTEEQVRSLKAEVDKDDNHWDVEFRAGDWEYDYEIHGESGAVLKSDKEYDPEKQAVSAPAETQPTQSDATRLTAEEAKAIALTHAGLTEEQVRSFKAELDEDRSLPKYEVEFVCNDWEYEYEIHAETGEILSSEKDR